MVRVWILAVLGFGALVSVTSLQAQAADKEPAVTRRTEVDEDFAFQGEYSGTLSADVKTDGGPSRETGLQVIALGNQQFTGVLLPNGLPGNGGDGKTLSIVNGERSGSMLTLRSEGLKIEIQNGVAKVIDSNAKVSGNLSHVLRTSKREGAPAPPNSYILFDGRGPGAFQNGKIVDGLLQCGTDLIPLYQDYLMHVEFLVPYMPASNSQARGNSGVYLQSRYEIQILDTFGREGLANECGGIYKQRAPRLNMAFPPLSWQTYDITFRSPRFDSQGRKIQNARLTLLHNGVKVHDNVDILDKTGAGQPEAPHLLPIKLQDHGNPVQFRNIWLVNLR